MTPPVYPYGADCYDWIVEGLSHAEAGVCQHLDAAARRAGAQLEFMLPAALAPTSRGLISGSVPDVLLADGDRA
jgi:hypothetical protein